MTLLQKNNGNWIDNPSEILEEFKNNFTNIFCSSVQCSIPFPSILNNLNQFTENEKQSLIVVVDPEEIKKALWDLLPLKTPRKDGLHAIFYKKNIGSNENTPHK